MEATGTFMSLSAKPTGSTYWIARDSTLFSPLSRETVECSIDRSEPDR
jgi:hypothetical protein